MAKNPGEIGWSFDSLGASGAIQGGIPMSYVFQSNLDTFVREVLQNSLDQKEGSGLVSVEFSFHTLTGQRKEQLLQEVNWNDLSPHLEGASRGDSIAAKESAIALAGLNAGPLDVLCIKDSGTKGLAGGETERGSNFTALCKNTLDTTEARPHRGGSYGLGKAVLWSFSSLSTVLFCSRIESEQDHGLRYFGKTELPYHETSDADDWDGRGFFGKTIVGDKGPRAESLWDSEAEAKASETLLSRSPSDGHGTSILILGFDEPLEEERRELKDVAEQVVESASRWFWPSLCTINPTLAVEAVVFHNEKEMYRQKAGVTPEVAPFVAVYDAMDTVDRVGSPGQVAIKTLSLLIPKRNLKDGAIKDEVGAELSLKVGRPMAGGESKEFPNRVALIRGAGMVVEYRRPTRGPIDDGSFNAVLLAGLRHGDSETDGDLEEFLRTAEPPSHREWTATQKVRVEYLRGSKSRLDTLFRDIDNGISELCEEPRSATTDGPAELARLFPLGGRGGGPVGGQSKFRVTQLQAQLDEDLTWSFSGHVTRHDSEGPWICDIKLWMDAETGRGEILVIDELTSSDAKIKLNDKFGCCEVASGTDEIRFSGKSKAVPVNDMDMPDPTRTRIRLEALPRNGGV